MAYMKDMAGRRLDSFTAISRDEAASRGGTTSSASSAVIDGRAPDFAKSPHNPLVTYAASNAGNSLGSVYWPWVVDTEGCGPIGAPGRYLMWWSTDHDANAGGIGMAYSESPDKDWTIHPGVCYTDVGFLSAGAAVTAVASTDTFTATAHGMHADQAVRFTGPTMGGISPATTYYLRDVTTNTFRLSPTRDGATLIDVTTNGAGTVYRVPSQTETPSVIWDDRGLLTAGSGLAVTATTDRITHTAHGMPEGRSVQITAQTGAAGLSTATTYYLRDVTTDSYRLAATRGGDAINITTDGTVTVAFYGVLNLYTQSDSTGTGTVPGYKQSTSLAVSPNGVDWTRIGVVLDTMWGVGVADSINPGDKHTGYFKPFRVGDSWAGYSLYGGGDRPNFGLWRSQDGRSWVLDTQLMTAGGTDFTGDPNRRISWSGNVFHFRGRRLILMSTKDYVSGSSPGVVQSYIAEVDATLRGFTGSPTATLTGPQPGGIETTVNDCTCVMVSDGRIYAYYRINGAQGAICCAVAEG